MALENVNFVTLDDIKRLINELPLEEKEKLLAEEIRELPTESKSKIFGLAESGLTVVTGSFVSLNSEIAVNIQNSGGFDPEKVFQALTEFRKAKKEKD
ncbi:hypothetical protein F7734_10270 [Scytonema sp. UIC 10036]|uniref:hypothetical protein n=1 Tax=Scytonema sp. UIC 10036 TaxID=2304196 RepID=UPI0012DA558D|nr:hypothetical protein [Scytonema sp. UIC 10036]MUG92813.1 hypothetical protein [Scytonema sp. UIC 10036]